MHCTEEGAYTLAVAVAHASSRLQAAGVRGVPTSWHGHFASGEILDLEWEMFWVLFSRTKPRNTHQLTLRNSTSRAPREHSRSCAARFPNPAVDAREASVYNPENRLG